jgi:EmrB/QacA subfamily drug resistance transporter
MVDFRVRLRPWSSMSADHDRPDPLRSLAVLAIGALGFALAQTTLIPTLTELRTELDTDTSGVAWVLTGYLLAAAVATPIAGRLGDMLGKRRLFVASLLVFAAGNVVSALGTSIEVVVAGRVLQGVGGGIIPLAISIIRDEFPAEKVPGSIGLISAIFGIGGGLGLVLGGILTDALSYHWIFWLGAIVAAVAALAAELFVPESPVRTPGRIDFRGALVLAAGLVPPLFAISRANVWGWGSARTLGLIAVGLVVLAGFVVLERRTADPLVDVRALVGPPVLMTNITTVLIGLGMFGSFLLIPQLAETPEASGYGFGLDATGAGLLLLPGSLFMLLAGPLSGALGLRFGSKVPLSIGALVTGVGLLLMGLSHETQLQVILWNVIMSIGFGLVFSAIPNLIVGAVPATQTGQAIGVNTLLRSVGASLGTQITAAIIAGTVEPGSPLPTDAGYSAAFFVCSAVAIVAGIAATLIPKPPAASVVAPKSAPRTVEPAYAGDR